MSETSTAIRPLKLAPSPPDPSPNPSPLDRPQLDRPPLDLPPSVPLPSSVPLRPSAPLKLAGLPRSGRPAWRRWLIDVERGLMHGVRGDSIFFVYFFLTSATIAASFVLDISLLQWTVVILALTVVLSAEMFNQSVKALFATLSRTDEATRTALRIGSAAVFVTIAGSTLTIGLILGKAAIEMFRGP